MNEVALTSSTFPTAIGVHASVKDGVQFAINQINSEYYKWPFNLVEGQTQVLTVGQELYNLPADFKTVDWESFYIQKSSSPSIETTQLRFLARPEWTRTFKESDYDTTTTGRGVPLFVFPWYNVKFGLTPSPTAAYTVVYNYWKFPTQLALHSDVTTIPSEWDHVITLGALWYGMIFKENIEGAREAERVFRKSLKEMRYVLISEEVDMLDTRVKFGNSFYAPGISVIGY